MSNTGLEEKVEKMNVEEKEAKGQKGSEKTKGEKKKKEDLSAFPLEVSELMIIYARLHVCVTPSNLSLIFQVFGKNGCAPCSVRHVSRKGSSLIFPGQG